MEKIKARTKTIPFRGESHFAESNVDEVNINGDWYTKNELEIAVGKAEEVGSIDFATLEKEVESLRTENERLREGRGEELNSFREWTRKNLDEKDIVTEQAIDSYLTNKRK